MRNLKSASDETGVVHGTISERAHFYYHIITPANCGINPDRQSRQPLRLIAYKWKNAAHGLHERVKVVGPVIG